MVTVGATAEPIVRGEGQQTADLAGTKLELFTYRPDTCGREQRGTCRSA
jgi:hypothetical protein